MNIMFKWDDFRVNGWGNATLVYKSLGLYLYHGSASTLEHALLCSNRANSEL